MHKMERDQRWQGLYGDQRENKNSFQQKAGDWIRLRNDAGGGRCKEKPKTAQFITKQILADGSQVAFQWDFSLDGAQQPQGAVSDEGGDNLINN